MKNESKMFDQLVLFFALSIGIVLLSSVIQPAKAEPSTVPQRGPVPFQVYDIDNNGCISPEELVRVQRMMMERRQNRPQGSAMARGQGQQMGSRRQANRPTFEYFDKNKDGYISEQELIEGRSMRISQRIQQGYRMKNTQNIQPFKEVDSDSDGQISRDEFNHHQMLHQQQRSMQRPY